jgi:hypothetical protein
LEFTLVDGIYGIWAFFGLSLIVKARSSKLVRSSLGIQNCEIVHNLVYLQLILRIFSCKILH